MVLSILIKLHVLYTFTFAWSGWYVVMLSPCSFNTSKGAVHCYDQFKRIWLCSLYEQDTCEFCVVFCVLFVYWISVIFAHLLCTNQRWDINLFESIDCWFALTGLVFIDIRMKQRSKLRKTFYSESSQTSRHCA